MSNTDEAADRQETPRRTLRSAQPDFAALVAGLETAIQGLNDISERSAATMETLAESFQLVTHELRAFREMQARERVISVIPVGDNDKGMLVITSHGRVIRCKLSEEGFLRPKVFPSLLASVPS